MFDTEIANRYRTYILEPGGAYHPDEMYLNFRGKEPDIRALLKKRGL
ncbi:MAG: hypothetical protein LBD45_00975 [Bacteroidales bacterium]|nr:hypothetical protein [Bacteroidales bacterium]